MKNEIFVFGSRIFPATPKQDSLSSLPLEISWKIFSYLDDASLRIACRVHQIWHRIIQSCKTLRRRLNMFELALTWGSRHLADFYMKCRKRRKKKVKGPKNYLPLKAKRVTVQSSSTIITKKRKGDDLVIHTKRYKLY